MGIDADTKKYLLDIMGEGIKFDEPMHRHTSFKAGGQADAFAVPDSYDRLLQLIKYAGHKKIEYFILGDGTNTLVKDRGYRGIIILLKDCLNKIVEKKRESKSIIIEAMAGVKLHKLCSFAIKKGFKGLNFAAGIPGTVGGGIIMNAGTKQGTMQDVIDSINVLMPNGKAQRIDACSLDFGYRELLLKKNIELKGVVILGGSFKLVMGDSDKLRREEKNIFKQRSIKHPKGYPSAGSFFKNPDAGKTAGELIDMAGLKGKKTGDAQISQKHGNFIINRGRASAGDILALMELVQETVQKKFNIHLNPEVKIIGE